MPMSVMMFFLLIRALERARGPGELYISILHRSVRWMQSIVMKKKHKEFVANDFSTDFFVELEKFFNELEKDKTLKGLFETYYSENRGNSRVLKYTLEGEDHLFGQANEVWERLRGKGDEAFLTDLAKSGAQFYKATVIQEQFGCN